MLAQIPSIPKTAISSSNTNYLTNVNSSKTIQLLSEIKKIIDYIKNDNYTEQKTVIKTIKMEGDYFVYVVKVVLIDNYYKIGMTNTSNREFQLSNVVQVVNKLISPKMDYNQALT